MLVFGSSCNKVVIEASVPKRHLHTITTAFEASCLANLGRFSLPCESGHFPATAPDHFASLPLFTVTLTDAVIALDYL